jgi:hypothetical protein
MSAAKTLQIQFLSGNPQVESLKYGHIDLFQEVPLNALLSGEASQQCFDQMESFQPKEESSAAVCMLVVPSHMIPYEMLHFITSDHRAAIASIYIFRHAFDVRGNYLALINLRTAADAKKFITDYHNVLVSALEAFTCYVYLVKSVNIPCSSAISSRNNSALFNCAFQSEVDFNKVDERRSGSDTLKLSNDDNIFMYRNRRSLTVPSPFLSCDEGCCPLCLEPFLTDFPQTFVTCCGHVFHIECIFRLEGPQCPLCRCGCFDSLMVVHVLR